jgi:hypothetical protein
MEKRNGLHLNGNINQSADVDEMDPETQVN